MNQISPSRRGLQTVRAETPTAVVQSLVTELNATVASFRKNNDERFAAVEVHVDALLRDFENLKLGGVGAAASPEAERLALAEIALFASAVQKRDVAPSEVDRSGVANYAKAFHAWLRRGEALAPDVRAEMSVGSDPDGGYWAPPTMSRDIKRRLFDTSPMRQAANVLSIPTDHIEFPTDTNDATSGGWVGETETRAETATPEVGMQSIYVREQYAMPIVTQKLLDMNMLDVESWLNGKIADKLRRTENAAFVSGTGVKQPRGFLDYKSAAVTTDDASRAWGVLQYVATGAAGDFPALSGVAGAQDSGPLYDIIAKLKPEYRQGAVWMMNRATSNTIMKLHDADGRRLWRDSLDASQPDRLLGYPVVLAEDMPDIASDSFSVAFGDFRLGYQIVDGPGLRILRDPYTTKGKVKFYTTKWTGGDVTDFDAIKLLKFAAS